MNTASLSASLQLNNTPWYARQVIHLLQEIEHGCLHLELPNGMQLTVGHGTPDAYLKFNEWKAFREVLSKGDIGFAEGYISGAWHTADLTGVLCLLATTARRSTRPSMAAGGDAWPAACGT